MDVYVGDGDVVKMKCSTTGGVKNPNMHEWVLRADADKLIDELLDFLNKIYESGIRLDEYEKELKELMGYNT